MTSEAAGPSTIGLVGDGPAIAVARATIEETPARHRAIAPENIDAVDMAIVSGVAGAGGFEAVNRVTVRSRTPWIGIEAGGIGGHVFDTVQCSVGGFVSGRGCHRCLHLRIAGAAAVDHPGSLAPSDEDPTTTGADLRLAGAIAGREIVRWLDGEPFSDLIEVPYRRRSFQIVPNCPVCEPTRDRSLDRGWQAVDLETTTAMADVAVDERVGIVATVGERESYPSPYYLAMLSNTEGFSDAAAMANAAGTDPDWDRAYVKAIGEALERYAAGVYRREAFASGRSSEVDSPVPPSRFVRPDDAPHADAVDSIDWVDGVDLTDGSSVSLPAEFVHFPPPEERQRPAITTGLGLGTSMDGALASGLLEVVERDATMLSWYSSYEPVGVSVDDERWDGLRRRANSEDLEVQAYLLTQDVDVPVVGVAVSREEWPRFAMGSAAGFDGPATAAAALAEAVQNFMELRALGPDEADRAGAAVARYADSPPEDSPFGSGGQGGPAVDAADIGPVDRPDGAAVVDRAVEESVDADLVPYAARLTTPDVEDLGFEVVRVLIPSAQPLFVGEPYFGERARSIPQQMGYQPRLDRAYHPYP